MDVSLMLGRKKEIEEFNFDLDGIVEMYKEVAEAQKARRAEEARAKAEQRS